MALSKYLKNTILAIGISCGGLSKETSREYGEQDLEVRDRELQESYPDIPQCTGEVLLEDDFMTADQERWRCTIGRSETVRVTESALTFYQGCQEVRSAGNTLDELLCLEGRWRARRSSSAGASTKVGRCKFGTTLNGFEFFEQDFEHTGYCTGYFSHGYSEDGRSPSYNVNATEFTNLKIIASPEMVYCLVNDKLVDVGSNTMPYKNEPHQILARKSSGWDSFECMLDYVRLTR